VAQSIEHLLVQQLVPQPVDKALDEGVLLRIAGRKGALNVAFAGLIFVVAAYMLVTSAASFA
jgi:hypothetical protein